MKITEILKQQRHSLSFEVFPPKTSDNFESVMENAAKIAQLSPSFMSVTYGAGGGTSDYTAEIARRLSDMSVLPLAHLTCISSTKEKVRSVLDKLCECGIENILALRGDKPAGWCEETAEYRSSAELMREIVEYGGFAIGGACYPEGHPELPTREANLAALRRKAECGCEFFTTQMFFDNDVYYRFIDSLSGYGIDVPVIAGIMPVTSKLQLGRIVSISASTLPTAFLKMVEKYGDDPVSMRLAGVDYAIRQASDLYERGVKAVHIYSMNKPDVARDIRRSLRWATDIDFEAGSSDE